MQYIDMADDPDDLTGAAEIVLERAQTLISTPAHKATGKPLIILMGEDHDTPLTQLFQLAVMQRCLAHNLRVSFGMEYRYDMVLSHDHYPFNLSKKERRYLQKPEHHRALLDHDFMIIAARQDESLRTRIAFCEDRHISVMFNDASNYSHAKTGHTVINAQDPLNKAIARELGHKGIPRNGDAENGLALRNHVILHHLEDQAQRTKADIIIQMLGDAHVFGWDDRALSAQNSLSSLCRKAGLTTIPIVTQIESDECPDDADFTNAILFENWQDIPYFKRSQQESCRAHLNEILTRLNLPRIMPMSDKEFAMRQDRFAKKLQRYAANTTPPYKTL